MSWEYNIDWESRIGWIAIEWFVKTTEGFQKLKKINEELKSQINNDKIYVRVIHFE